jgi:flagellar biosynthesis/type III secretory pathway chaperone
MDSIIKQDKLIHYQNIILIWENFCQLHKQLYDLTCEEYLTLLASDIDSLEVMLPMKEEIISNIGLIEKDRADLIHQINESGIFPVNINSASELIGAFSDIETERDIPALKNLNSLLIDIIEKIQDQNKKNQIFLNKAMLSIREIKQSFSGQKTYTTYGADGLTRSLHK